VPQTGSRSGQRRVHDHPLRGVATSRTSTSPSMSPQLQHRVARRGAEWALTAHTADAASQIAAISYPHHWPEPRLDARHALTYMRTELNELRSDRMSSDPGVPRDFGINTIARLRRRCPTPRIPCGMTATGLTSADRLPAPRFAVPSTRRPNLRRVPPPSDSMGANDRARGASARGYRTSRFGVMRSARTTAAAV
jgi:hypothetical protein